MLKAIVAEGWIVFFKGQSVQWFICPCLLLNDTWPFYMFYDIILSKLSSRRAYFILVLLFSNVHEQNVLRYSCFHICQWRIQGGGGGATARPPLNLD